jgi:tape measure domain-containing protein
MANSGNPVAELFARLGLDTKDFDRDLRASIQNMIAAGNTVDSVNKRLESAARRITKVNPGVSGEELRKTVDLLRSAPIHATTEQIAGALEKGAIRAEKSAAQYEAQFAKIAKAEADFIEKSASKARATTLGADQEAQLEGARRVLQQEEALAARRLQVEQDSAARRRELQAQQAGDAAATYRLEQERIAASARAARQQEVIQRRQAALVEETLYSGRRAGIILTAAVTAPIVGMGIASFKAAGEIEVARASLTRLTGSATEANAVIERVKKLTIESPFDFRQTLEGTRRVMTSLRVDGTTAVNILRVLGDTVAATGGGEDTLLRIVKALSDVKNQGFLASQEIRQFANANINVVEIIGRKLGITAPEVLDKIKNKAIDANTAIQAIVEGLDQKFGGEGLARLNTNPGQMQQLRDQWFLLMSDIGQAIKPVSAALIDIGKTGVVALRQVLDAAKALPGPFQAIIASGFGIAAAAGPILTAGSQIGLTLIGLQAASKAVDIPLKALGIQLTAAGLATKGLGLAMTKLPWIGMAAAAAYVGYNVFKLGNQLDDTFDKFENFQKKTMGDSGVNLWNRPAWVQKSGEDISSGLPKVKLAELPDPEQLKKEAEEAANKARQAWQSAFGSLDLTDHSNQLKELTANYRLIRGALSEFQQQSASTKIAGALRAQYEDGVITLRQYVSELNRLGVGNNATAGTLEVLHRGMELNESIFASNLSVTDSLAASISSVTNGFLGITEAQTLAAITATNLNEKWETLNATGELISKTRAESNFKALFGDLQEASSEKGALKILGVSEDRDLTRMGFALNTLQGAYEKGEISVRSLNRATLNYYRAALEQGAKLTPQQERHRQELEKQVNVVSRMQRAWRGVTQQISSIITDFSRGVLDILFPKNAGDQNSRITDAFRDAFDKLSAQGFSNPNQGLKTIIANIKTATSVAEANRIALAAFGDIGPQIARALRDGSLEGDRLAESLDKASVSIAKLDEGPTKLSKFKALLGEVRTAILRAFVEEGAKAISDFVGKHLKDLINGLDSVLVKIPIIGKGLAGIFGNTAGKAGEVAINQIPGNVGLPPLPTGPGGSIPSGGGAGGAAGGAAQGGLMSTIGVVSGVASAVSSIIGNFQMFGMNKSLDIIVKHTLQTANDLANLRADEWSRETHLMLKLDDVWNEVRNVTRNTAAMLGGVTVLPTNGTLSGAVFNIYLPESFTPNSEESEALEVWTRRIRREGLRLARG